MDAFAVSITNGIIITRLRFKDAVRSSFFFGFFQFIMPVLGCFLGNSFSRYIIAYDHWVAFILLALIGGKMLIESFKPEEIKSQSAEEALNTKNMIMLAIATSIDAMAVGVTFAVTGTKIFVPCIIIGIVTFVICMAGILLGKQLGAAFKAGSERLGGIILMVIGFLILNEHLMLF